MVHQDNQLTVLASVVEGGRVFVFLAVEGMEGVAVSPAWTSPEDVPNESAWTWQFHCGPDPKTMLPEFARLALPVVSGLVPDVRQRLVRRLQQGKGQVAPGAGDLATPYLFSPGEGTTYGLVLPGETRETNVKVGCREDFPWKFMLWSAAAQGRPEADTAAGVQAKRARLVTHWLFTCLARLLLGVGPVREERVGSGGPMVGKTPGRPPAHGDSAADGDAAPMWTATEAKAGTLHGDDCSRHLMLLEFIVTDRFRVRRNEYHPFIQALAHAAGWTVSRAWVGVEAIAARTGRNLYIYDLPAPDRTRVETHLRALNPSHVLLNERLAEPLFQKLQQAVPDASFRMNQVASSAAVSGLLEEWLGIHVHPGAGLLEEQVRPNHQGMALNAMAKTIRPFVPLLVGPECSYHRSLAGNPWFQGVDCSELNFSGGCSFCLHQDRTDRLPTLAPEELALRQVRDAVETIESEVCDRDFLVRGVNLLPVLDKLAVGLSEEGVSGCRFFVTSRLDSVVVWEAALRCALDHFSRSGNSLHLWSIGVENLSEEENLRFNKGLTSRAVEQGVRLVHKLAEDYPEIFGFSGFGFILFTPWTTLDDLRQNARGFRSLGFTDMSRYLWTALQLLPGQPITRLAETQGLVVKNMEDLRADSGCITSWDDVEIPWRFRDQRVRQVYHVCRRLVPGGAIPDDDPARQVITSWRNGLPPHLRFSKPSSKLLRFCPGTLHWTKCFRRRRGGFSAKSPPEHSRRPATLREGLKGQVDRRHALSLRRI